MSVSFLVAEVSRTLRQEIARKFAAHPRATVAVALAAGFIAVIIAWSMISALLWPPKRNVYGTVSGTVTSVSGAPVSEVMVLFVNDAAGGGASARTDSGGRFAAQGIRAGRYAVAIQPVIDLVGGELTKEQALAARSRLETSVPVRFQEVSTSGLTVDLLVGRNQYDIDLRTAR